MKISDVTWKGMHPASLMQDVAKALGTEDPKKFLRIHRTDLSLLCRISGMGHANIRHAVAAMEAAGLDVEGAAPVWKILEFLQQNAEQSALITLIGVVEQLIRSGGDDPRIVTGLFRAALLAWGERTLDDEHLHVVMDDESAVSGTLYYRDAPVAFAVVTTNGMEVTEIASS